jgi:hypothetical protein
MAKRIFEKTFVIHEYGLKLSDLEAPLLKADHIFWNPFSNKTLFFSRCKMRLVKITLDEKARPKESPISIELLYATPKELSRIPTAWIVSPVAQNEATQSP